MERIFDVHLELDPLELAIQADPTRTVAELSRRSADEMCLAHGLRLRHPDPREVVTKAAVYAATGKEVVLVATRWVADAPG